MHCGDRPYPDKDMATEKAILSLFRIPSSLFIVQKGWPFFCNELEVWVVVVKHGNGPGERVSDVHGRLALLTHLDPPRMHPDACEGSGTLLLRGAPSPSAPWVGLPGLGPQGHGP